MSEERDSVVRRLFKSGAFMFGGQVFELAISFIAALLIARYLGPTGYGAVAIGVTVVEGALAFLLLGLSGGVARYLPRYDELADRRGIVVSSFQLTLPTALLVAGALFVGADPIATRLFHDPDVAPVLRVFAFAIPFAVVRELSLGVMKGLQRSLPTVVVRNIAFPGIRFLVAVPAVLLSLSTVGVAWVYVVPFLVTGVLGAVFLLRDFPLFRSREYTPMHRELLIFSLPLMISGAMARVLRDLDTILLSYFSETASVGVYNIVYPLAMLPLFVLTSFSYLFMPAISELHADDRQEDMGHLYRLVTKWVFFGTLPIFLPIAVFAQATIRLTFGPDFVSGALALSVLSSGYAFSALVGPNSSLLTSIGRSRLVMYDNAFAAALNLVANVLLIPQYGIVGAASATVLSYFVMNVLFSYQVYDETGIHPVSTAIVKPAIAAFALIGGIYVLVNYVIDPGFVGIGIIFAGFLCLYGASLLALGAVEREEVMLILQFEDRFDVDLGPLKRLAAKLMNEIPED